MTCSPAGDATEEAGGGERSRGPAPVWSRGGAGPPRVASSGSLPADRRPATPGGLVGNSVTLAPPGGDVLGGGGGGAATLGFFAGRLGTFDWRFGPPVNVRVSPWPPGARRRAGPCGWSVGPLRSVAVFSDSAALRWALGPRDWFSRPLRNTWVYFGSAATREPMEATGNPSPVACTWKHLLAEFSTSCLTRRAVVYV